MKLKTVIIIIVSLIFYEGYSQNNQLRIKPVTYIDSSMNHKMTVKELLKKDRLYLLTCPGYESKLKIIRHVMVPDIPSYGYEITSNSDSITELQKKYIRMCPTGKKIFFDDIKVKIQDSDSIINANPLIIEIIGPEGYVAYFRKRTLESLTNSDDEHIVYYYLKKIDSLFVRDNVNNINFTVKGFRFSYKDKTFDSNSNLMTDDMIKVIKRIKPVKNEVQSVSFHAIRFEDDEGNEFYANDIKLLIWFDRKDLSLDRKTKLKKAKHNKRIKKH